MLQWTLGDEVTVDPAESSFRKAMDLADGTVSVMDAGAVCFKRVWCVFEITESILRAAEEEEEQAEEEEEEEPYKYGESPVACLSRTCGVCAR